MKNKFLALFLILSPGFWWLVMRPVDVFSELFKAPHYFSQRIKNVYSEERLFKIRKTRWSHIDNKKSNQLISRVFYNKGTLLLDEFFSFTTFLSLRIYFQAGDGSNLSPPGVEPIAVVLLPFFIWGILLSIKEGKFKYVFVLISFAFLAFIFGQRNFAFLWPVLILMVYFSAKGVETIKKSWIKKSVIFVTLVYCLYLGGRVLWLLG